MGGFAEIADGRENRAGCGEIPRHRHDRAYVAIVLSGAYEECGSRGRFRVGAGDVLTHEVFEAHLDRFGRSGARILNITDAGVACASGLGRVGDPDAIARAGETDCVEACAQLRQQFREIEPPPEDWPDILARDLLRRPTLRLDDWAATHALACETVSRGFCRVFGITPVAFRAEARAQRAFAGVVANGASLAAVAAAEGFADQAHMSRAVRALTGASPGAWRKSIRFKTDAARSA